MKNLIKSSQQIMSEVNSYLMKVRNKEKKNGGTRQTKKLKVKRYAGEKEMNKYRMKMRM